MRKLVLVAAAVLALGLWSRRRGLPPPAPPAARAPDAGYDPSRDAFADIQAALSEARRTKKRVLVEVGGNWCSWCRVLDAFFRAHPDVTTLRDANFVTVKVDVEPGRAEPGALARYPPVPGYPHFFVLDADEKVLESKNTEELESGGDYDPERFVVFLKSWTPS